MSQYIAKKATLDIKKECSNRSCGCYTEKGYYIRYANRNVDSILFVCEECFERKYRNQCVVQNFTVSEEPIHHNRRVEIDHPTLRRIIRAFNKSLRFIKYASLCFLIIASILVGVFSKEYQLRDFEHQDQSKSIHISDTFSERFDKLMERIQYVMTEERLEQ